MSVEDKKSISFHQIGVDSMVKKATLIKKPTGYESECTHCGTTNFSKDAESQLVCKMCNKEYLATVAHTEED